MAIGASTFNNLGGAVSDLFAASAARTTGRMRAEGQRIGAEGTRINAAGLRIKAQGDIAEAENYDLAAGLARKEKSYVETSTAIQQTQLDRKISMTIGGQRADVAAAGLKEGGSALDLLADSASQGALAKSVLAQQGVITEEGYEEQAKSFETMATSGRTAAAGIMDIANRTDAIATREDALAVQTEDAARRQSTGLYITAGLRAAAAVASIFDVSGGGGGGGGGGLGGDVAAAAGI